MHIKKMPVFVTAAVLFAGLLITRPVSADTQNLVPNPSLETVQNTQPENWLTDQWGTNTAKFTYLTSGHTGSRSVKVQITSYTDGDAKWYYAPQPATPGATYTISDYYKSNIVSRVVVMFNLTSGTQEYIELSQAPASRTNWALYTDTVTAPAESASMSVFHLISKVGWLTTDDYSVTSASITPPPPPEPGANLIANSSVETQATTSMPLQWNKEKWGTNAAKFSYVKTGGHTGTHSLKVQITSYTDGDAKWFFNSIPVSGGQSYTFSDWYKSNITSQVVVYFVNADGSENYLGLRDAPASSLWAQYSESFEVPAAAVKMTVFHLIGAIGWLTTDDYSLTTYTPKGLTRSLVSLTFDDGWEENVSTALPILAQHGFKSTYYFATTYLENSPVSGPANVSGPTAVNTIYADGHEIGSHSVTHPDLTLVPSSQLTDEITDSKNYLENIVGAGKVKSFALPFGAYNDTVNAALKTLYTTSRTTDEGFNTLENFDPYRLKVRNLQPTTTVAQYQSWVSQAIADKSWLILVYHRVVDADLNEWDTYRNDFIQHMEFLKNSGVTVMPVTQALSEVTAQL